MIHLHRPRLLLLGLALVTSAIALQPHHVAAQSFPEHPVKLVSPWPPGGSNDTFC